MSASHFAESEYTYVPYVTWTDICEQNARCYGKSRTQEALDKELAIARDVDSIIAHTGSRLAQIVGVKQITERPGTSRWLCANRIQHALARAVNSDYDLMQHAYRLYAGRRLMVEVLPTSKDGGFLSLIKY